MATRRTTAIGGLIIATGVGAGVPDGTLVPVSWIVLTLALGQVVALVQVP